MIENFKLKVFRVVADSLNFRRAADELNLTQPAVTAQIRSLEESLGIALFDRIGRDVTLTPSGRTLLEYVRQIEAISNYALAALAIFGGQQGIELTIGASHSIAVYLLRKLLASLVDEWPKLRIHVVSGSTNEVLHALTSHQIAMGLIEALCRRISRTQRSAAPAASHFHRHDLHRRHHLCGGSGSWGGLRSLGGAREILAAGSVKTITLENGPIVRNLSSVLLNGPEPKGPAGRLLELVRQNGAQTLRVPGVTRKYAQLRPRLSQKMGEHTLLTEWSDSTPVLCATVIAGFQGVSLLWSRFALLSL